MRCWLLALAIPVIACGDDCRPLPRPDCLSAGFVVNVANASGRPMQGFQGEMQADGRTYTFACPGDFDWGFCTASRIQAFMLPKTVTLDVSSADGERHGQLIDAQPSYFTQEAEDECAADCTSGSVTVTLQ